MCIQFVKSIYSKKDTKMSGRSEQIQQIPYFSAHRLQVSESWSVLKCDELITTLDLLTSSNL